MSVHSVEVRFQARNSCGSNSAAVFKIKKIATKRVLNQNISARKRIRSILKSYQKQETIFVNLVACFFVLQRCYNQGNYYKRNSFPKGDDLVPNQNLKDDILEATIKAFQKKGLKFTMDDIASLLGISKKTIYTVFPDKNSLVLEMVDYCFSSIKESEQEVLQDLSLDTVGKIRAILGVLPEGYRELDLRQLYQLKERYPEVYEKVKSRLETGWESTISLLEQGITEGKIRNIQIPILKTMMEATLEQFFQRDVLVQNGISYHEALDEVVSILIDGITI